MNHLTLLVAMCLTLAAVVNGQKKVVCYYASWTTYSESKGKYDISDIDPNLCTHIIYSFIGISADGGVRVLDPWIDVTNNGFKKFTDLCKNSPSLKAMVAIGGWNEGSINYSNIASDPSLRKNFVHKIVQFLRKYNFNGLDFDWEYPAQRGGKASDKQNFVQLLKELKERFVNEGLLLSAAVSPSEYSAQTSYNIGEVSKYLDFINLMTYDFHGTFDEDKKVGHNSPLYPSSMENQDQKKLNIDYTVKYWISHGAPSGKIILGTGFHGRSFTLADPNQHKRGSPFIGPGNPGPYTKNPGTLAYHEICELLKTKNWKIEYDEEQHVPYAYKGNQIVGFDNVTSLKEKAKYVKRMNLGGAMLWSMDNDDFNGYCGEKYPLLKTLNSVLRT